MSDQAPSSTVQTSVTPTTKRGENRRQAVLDAALDLFLEYGFAATSLEKIIEKAGGSRRTIYQMFGGKEGLLKAVVSEGCNCILSQLQAKPIDDLPPKEALTHLATVLLSQLITPRGTALYRLVVAESTHAPELGRVFMAAGPERGQEILLNYFKKACEKGELQLKNPEVSARQFIEFVRGDLSLHALFYGDYADSETLARHIDVAVDVFLQGTTGQTNNH